MAGFFSVRLAPGVRVSAGPRGLRAHLGPRAARLHVGGGRSGVSTGAGPFTVYESLGGHRGDARPYATGATAAEIARADKARKADLIAGTLTAIGNLHRQTFPAARRVTVPPGPVPTLADLLRNEERRAVAGIAWYRFGERRRARRAARPLVGRRAQALRAEAERSRLAAQERLDRHWQRLLANDEDAVLAALATAFEDNEAPVAAVGVTGDDVALAVLVPGPDVLPDHYPTTTEAGNLSLRKVTRTIAAEWYRQLVSGHAVVSAKEAFAVCPGLASATVVVLRDGGRDVYGARRALPVLATRLSRDALARVRWECVTAWDVIEQTGLDTLTRTRGVTRELQPLDLAEEPDLAAVAAAVDLEGLAEADPAGR